MSRANPPKDLRVGNKYRIGRKIGSGSFGDIYLGTYPRLASSLFVPSLLTLLTRYQHHLWRRDCHQA
jgi:hypothetical protein